MGAKNALILLVLFPGLVLSQGLTGGTASVGFPAAPTLTGGTGGDHKWFVQAGGSGDGHTAAAPFATIQRAVDSAKTGGDSIFVMAGTYNETITLQYSGTSGAPIVITNYDGDSVIVAGASTTAQDLLVSNSKSYVIVQGLHFKWRTDPTTGTDGLYVITLSGGSGTGLKLRYCTMTNGTITDTSGWAAIRTQYNAGNSIRGIVMRANGHTIEYCNIRGYSEGIVLDGAAPRAAIIQENWIHNNAWCGIIVGGGSAANTMQYNIIRNNLIEDCVGEDGIQFQPSSSTIAADNWGTIISMNVIRDCGENAVDMKAGRYITVEKNIVYRIEGDDDGQGMGGATAGDENSSSAIMMGSGAWSRQIIVRQNVIYSSHGGVKLGTDWQVYNNTLVSNNRNYAGAESATNTTVAGLYAANPDPAISETNTYRMAVNNIVMNQTLNEVFSTGRGTSGWNIDYNNYYRVGTYPRLTFMLMTPLSPPFSYYTSTSWADWQSQMATNATFAYYLGKDVHSRSLAPAFTDVPDHPTDIHDSLDFTLTSTSELIDKGGEITYVTASVTSTNITVYNSWCIQPGWTTPSWTGDSLVIVHNNSTRDTVRVLTVNSSTHVLTVNKSITVIAGEKVYLYPITGLWPDIGAREYGVTWGGGTTAPPAVTAPSATTLVSPADGSTQAQPVTLVWRTSTGATSYLVDLSQDGWVSDIRYTVMAPDTQKIVSAGLTQLTNVQWNVRADNTYTGTFSPTWSFTTGADPAPTGATALTWKKAVNQFTLTENSALSMTDLQGVSMYAVIHNPLGKSVTWPSNVTWMPPGSSAPVVGTVGVYLFVCDSARVYGFPMSSMLTSTGSATLVTAAPVVTSPILPGATTASGTSTEANGTVIQLYRDGVADDTTLVNAFAWSKTGLDAYVAGELVKAKATAAGKTASAFSNTVTVSAVTAAPVVTSPILPGATSVSGTIAEADGTLVQVYLNSSTLLTAVASADSAWTKTGCPPFEDGQLIKAKATATGKLESAFSNTVTVGAAIVYTAVLDTVGNTADDGMSNYNSNDETATGAYNWVGNRADSPDRHEVTGFRFNLAIPAGATIDTVALTFYAYSTDIGWPEAGDSLLVRVYADTCGAFADAHTHALTVHADTAALAFTCPAPTAQGAWTVQGWDATSIARLATVFQQTISDTNWATGRYAGFVIDLKEGASTAGDDQFSVTDYSSGSGVTYYPRIRVVYHEE